MNCDHAVGICTGACRGDFPESRTCIGCGTVAELRDDLCAGCWKTADELDRDLERAAAAHFPREVKKTVRIPIESMRQVIYGSNNQSKETI